METGLGFVFLKIAGLLGEWIGWLLICLGIMAWKSRGVARALAATLFVSTYLLAIPFGCNLLCKPLEAPYPIPEAATLTTFDPQAVVVLGGGIVLGRLTGDHVAPHALARTNIAWQYAKELQLPLLATGAGKPRSEGALMIEQALRWGGIPEGIVENRATTTLGNALRSREILAKRGIDRILLVSSASHLRRSVRAFEEEGFQVLPIPSDSLWQQSRGWLWELRPTGYRLADSAYAIHEWVGYLVGR